MTILYPTENDISNIINSETPIKIKKKAKVAVYMRQRKYYNNSKIFSYIF